MDFTMPTNEQRGVSVRVQQSQHVWELQRHIIQNLVNFEEILKGQRLVAATANCWNDAVALTLHIAPKRRAKAALLGLAFNEFVKDNVQKS